MLLSVLLAAAICMTSAVLFTAPAGQDSCFFDELKTGDAVMLMYQVTSGGALDIDLTVRRKREEEGRGRRKCVGVWRNAHVNPFFALFPSSFFSFYSLSNVL